MEAYKWDEAIGHFQDAMKHAVGPELTTLHFLVGRCHHAPGRWKKALESFEESSRLAEQFGDKQGKAAALDNIGVIRRERGEFDKALENFETALGLAREIGARQEEASALNNIGGTRLYKGESEEVVLKYFEDSLKICQEIGDREGQASRFINIAIACPGDKAMDYAEKGLKLARETGAKKLEAGALANIGFLLKDKAGPDEMLRNHQDALKLLREIGDKQGEASTLANIGGWLVQGGKHEQALEPYLTGFMISSALDLAQLSGPERFRWGLGKCLDALGRDKFIAACEKAGMPKLEAEKLAKELGSPAGKI